MLGQIQTMAAQCLCASPWLSQGHPEGLLHLLYLTTDLSMLARAADTVRAGSASQARSLTGDTAS